MSNQFDLVIVGGGMVGSALASALANTQLSIALIETHIPTAPQSDIQTLDDVDVRVSALNRASENFLNTVGAWQAISSSRTSHYNKMRVWDGEGTGHIQFSATEMGESHLGCIVENRVTASALFQQLQNQSNLRVYAPNTVKEIETVTLDDSEQVQHYIHLDDGQVLFSPLIVAADGARSFVRQWAEFSTREWDYGHHGLVCTIETERSHEDCAWQRFTETGVLAFLPLNSASEKNLVSIVWSCPEEQASRLLALTEDEFNKELARTFEYKLGAVLASGTRAAIPLRQRHAKRYIKPGVVLVGDAAHTIHPLAGQGVNLGLMDAYVLADEIRQGHKRGIAPSNEQLLSRYERRRMPENLTMMATMESFKRLFAQTSPALRWIRNWGMSKVNQLGFIKNHIVQEAMGLKRDIR